MNSGAIVVILVLAALVVVGGLSVWLLDARRNKEVENDEERFAPDPAEKDSPR